LYASSDGRAGEEGVDWERRITDALQDGGLFLHYQPLVALEGDQTPRYEARVRLAGEEGEELGPEEFMPYADELGLTPRIDRWVVGEVARQLATHKKAGKKTIIFAKVGGTTLSDGEFVQMVSQTLDEQGVEGWRLTFELNEPIAVTQLNQAKQFYKAIKELKCGFVLDQFGSGLNPFQLLKHLPAEYVKLDRTVVEQLSRNDGDPDSVRETIENAHEMRKKVIGGYVEGAMELAQLWQYDVDLVQGNFLAAPHPEMNYDFSGMVM
jgi:EAL domain-containing protein (putative c-di-GMP-specific phosphodiesterase class I)